MQCVIPKPNMDMEALGISICKKINTLTTNNIYLFTYASYK